jgi:hypothetical protein
MEPYANVRGGSKSYQMIRQGAVSNHLMDIVRGEGLCGGGPQVGSHPLSPLYCTG